MTHVEIAQEERARELLASLVESAAKDHPFAQYDRVAAGIRDYSDALVKPWIAVRAMVAFASLAEAPGMSANEKLLSDAVATLDVYLSGYKEKSDTDAFLPDNDDDDLLTWGHLRTIVTALNTVTA